MKLVTFSGPPSSGKTSVIIKLIRYLQNDFQIGVVKFDCLTSSDNKLYRLHGIPVQTGVSGALCPDHFFASNIGACMKWGERQGLELLVSESAGLCNRCSPHLRGVLAVCVIDILSGIDAPRKIGPMLKLADIILITKGDLVSQAEREVFALNVIRANPRAKALFVNGLTGQGMLAASQTIRKELADQREGAQRLRFSMPGAVCSYCFGETKIGDAFATGNIKYMNFDDDQNDKDRDDGNEVGTRKRIAPLVPNSIEIKTSEEMFDLINLPYNQIEQIHPISNGFFAEMGIDPPPGSISPRDYFDSFDEFDLLDCGMDASQLGQGLAAYIEHMERIGCNAARTVEELRIMGGIDKAGSQENVDITVRAGDVICIVGPTGSGKSRLLEDIEYLAQGDTPTKRRVLIDGAAPSEKLRYTVENKLVAQLSQSMVFVMDLPVRDFLRLHAKSRMMPEENIDSAVSRTIACAHSLAGEAFSPDASLTMLSGGQSRALMIADLTYISASPIILIDEIENAGVDRKRALNLFLGSEKIVFIVTHDPLIALMGKKRVVIGNGGMRTVIDQSEAERDNARRLCALDDRLMDLRSQVRMGNRIEFDIGSSLALCER